MAFRTDELLKVHVSRPRLGSMLGQLAFLADGMTCSKVKQAQKAAGEYREDSSYIPF
jgi:hypothetical protein